MGGWICINPGQGDARSSRRIFLSGSLLNFRPRLGQDIFPQDKNSGTSLRLKSADDNDNHIIFH